MRKKIVGGLCAALALAVSGGVMTTLSEGANAAPAKKQATKKPSQKDAQRRYLDELIADNEAMSRGGPSSCYDTHRTTAQQQRVLRNMGGEPCANASAPVPPSRSTPSTASLRDRAIGMWIVLSRRCGGEADLILKPDGEYLSSFEIGRWTMTGATLTLTALQQAMEGEDPTDIPYPKPIQFAVQMTGSDSLVLTRPGDTPQRLKRCR